MDRGAKQQEVAQLKEKFAQATAVYLTEYRGLTVEQITAIRSELRTVDAELRVAKNRLVKLSLSEEIAKELQASLAGPVAFTFTKEDTVGPAKILTKYVEEFEPFVITGGLVRGEAVDVKGVEALSKLPSREELYAMLLRTLVASAGNLARVLQGVSSKLVRVIGAIQETKKE
jgi:large subunit ribosomal protein L10